MSRNAAAPVTGLVNGRRGCVELLGGGLAQSDGTPNQKIQQLVALDGIAIQSKRGSRTEAEIAFLHREIALTYEAQARQWQTKPSKAALRCADLERYLKDRYGDHLPDDDAGRDDAFVMLHQLAWRGETSVGLGWWLGRRCPWMTDQEAANLVQKVLVKPRRWSADQLGKRLGLTYDKRRSLGITTIGAADVSKEQRAVLRKAADRDYQRAKRRTAGVQPRAEYLAACLSKTEPWKPLGIHRRTWERRRKAAADPLSQVRRQHASEESPQPTDLRQLNNAAARKSALEESLAALRLLGRGTDRPVKNPARGEGEEVRA